MEESSGCAQTEAEVTSVTSRIILVGKTGSGKSTLGNILLQKADVKKKKTDTSSALPENSENQAAAVPSGGNEDQGFTVDNNFGSVTETCGYKESQAWGRRMKVIDTPGLFDTEQDHGKVFLELSKVMRLSTPGPNAILFVTRCDLRFTEEEFRAYEKIVDMFGEKIKQHLVLVFSRGDTLDGETIEDLLEKPECPSNLKKVMKTVGDNYTVISKTSDPAVREKEVKKLLQKIDSVSKNGKKYYTNDDLEKMTKANFEETMKLMKKLNIGWDEAEYRLKTGIAEEAEKFEELLKTVFMIAIGSAACISVIGVTGGLGAIYVVGATATEALTAAGCGTATGLVATNAIALFAAYKKKHKKIKAYSGDKNSGSCQIL